jgi:predicted TPR repeat methyltransferase
MDYDKTRTATIYDAARGYRPEVLDRWLDLIAANVSVQPKLIVDLGCGTGRFTYPLAERCKRESSVSIPRRKCWIARARSSPTAVLNSERRPASRSLSRTDAPMRFSCRWYCATSMIGNATVRAAAC